MSRTHLAVVAGSCQLARNSEIIISKVNTKSRSHPEVISARQRSIWHDAVANTLAPGCQKQNLRSYIVKPVFELRVPSIEKKKDRQCLGCVFQLTMPSFHPHKPSAAQPQGPATSGQQRVIVEFTVRRIMAVRIQ